jgi:hypothetical protein
MSKDEIKKRYWKWHNDPNTETLPYLEEWEQWHYSIKLYDPELYEAIKKMRTELGVVTNTVGLDFIFE